MAEEKKNNAPEQSLSEILHVREKSSAHCRTPDEPFEITKYDVTHHAQEIKDDFDALEGKPVSVAGRLMSKRAWGRSGFWRLQDRSGRIQLYARGRDGRVGIRPLQKCSNIGDIVGVEGEVFRTQRVREMRARTGASRSSASRSSRCREVPRPDGQGLRYRQRYVDLIVSPESKRNFEIRSRFVCFLAPLSGRPGLHGGGDPVLSPICGRRQRAPVHHAPQHARHRHVIAHRHVAAPEAPSSARLERVYEVGRIFRNEGVDTNTTPSSPPASTIRPTRSWTGMMDILEGILTGAAQEISAPTGSAGGALIDLTPAWPRVTMADAVRNVTGADFHACEGDATPPSHWRSPSAWTWTGSTAPGGNALYETFDQKVEETLIQPTFITMYPVEVSPLASAARPTRT
jgi:lysyl-tRNA synthetase class 2